MIRTDKTVYSPKGDSDGKRVLVMRIWPRGISRSKVDLWLKELGTERELIKKWKEGRVTWGAYSKLYLESLKGKENILKKLAEESRKGTVTLLCSCKDEARCHRSLLRRAVERVSLDSGAEIRPKAHK
jgi:uncharacterized protein YeaO (DUF488 family)